MEIIISDDCSDDLTSLIIEEEVRKYKGKKKIIINKNKENLGIIKHINKLFSLANGEIIATNPGDDVSTPNRISDTVEYFIDNKDIQMVTFSRTNIDKDGIIINEKKIPNDIIYTIDNKYLTQESMMAGGTAVAFKKEVYTKFGPFNDNAQTEDSTLRFRALLLGNILYSSKIGVKYRIHGNNISHGSTVYRLKTHPIAEQYRKDLEVVKGNISPKLYTILRKKINYYEINRETESVLALSSSKIKKVIYRIRRKIARYIYKREMQNYF